jgi:8-oxo-dGTP pyrophosphatase MutT (NUDIX family)
MKAIPGAQSPSPANQGLPGISTSQISPLARELDSGGATGTWSNAYRSYLPRPAQTFTDGAFGPFSPILPVPVDAPPEDSDLPEPRLFQYEVGWNLPVGQPGSEGIKLADFNTLRTLADVYSVARAAIQLRKSEIRSLEWDIMPTKEASKAMRGDRVAMRDFGERRAQAMKFFKKPDSDYFSWNTFIDALLEEVFVFDALSVLFRKKWAKGRGRGLMGSDFDSLSLLSGSTIRPLLGLHGERPRPPAVAYQQYLYGVPRVDLMTLVTDRDLEYGGLTGAEVSRFQTDQLLYLPMTPRRWTPYGFPPIERALVPVMAGLQKQGYQLDYFREGTVPAVYISPGDSNANMTPNQIRELQDALNAVAGDPAWKHKILVLPSGSKVDPQRPPQIADAFDEVVMNQVCMAFDVMPMELGIAPKVSTTMSSGAANQMSKMTSTMSDRKATKPTLQYLSDIFDMVLQDACGQDDMRFVFEGQIEEDDEATTTTLVVNQVNSGLRSIDEGREKLNLPPWGLPETSDPGWATPATGFVTLAEASATRQASLQATQQLAANGGKPPEPGQESDDKKPGGGSPGGSQQSPGHEAAEGHETSQKTPPDVKTDTQKARRPVHAGAARHQARRQNRVDASAKRVTLGLRRIVDQYQEGEIDAATGLNEGVQHLATGYRQVMRAAAGDARRDHGITGVRKDDGEGDDDSGFDDLSSYVDSEASSRAESQRPFLMGLFKDLATGGALAQSRLSSRLDLYGRTLVGAYNIAYGRTLQADGSYQIVWHLGASEHCGACIARDGITYTFHSLPGWPGDGDFGDVCLGGPNCKCSLEYIKEGDPVEEGTNTLRDDDAEVGYYQQQLSDITARRNQAEDARQRFLATVPEPSRSQAQTRDDIRRQLADMGNQRARQNGGWQGISVEPSDISAEQVHSEMSNNALYRMVYSEMEAAARHLSKGLTVSEWNRRNLTFSDLRILSSRIKSGMEYKAAARLAMRRIVDTNGQERWTEADEGPQGGPAGGGGPFLSAHDVNGIYGADKSATLTGCDCCGGSGEHATGHECYRCDAGGSLYPSEIDSPKCDEVFRSPAVHDKGCPHCSPSSVKSDADRQAAGIDGTSGDAQDVLHEFKDNGQGACALCGLGQSHAKHSVMCPCGIPVAYDTENGWQHADGSISHDDDESVSDKMAPRMTDAAHGAFQTMAGDFPAHAIVWMAFVKWQGPIEVTADDIDFEDAGSWAADHEAGKVAKFAKKLLTGEDVRPILLVKKPGHDKAMVVDGHHRALASRMVSKPVRAYLAKVPTEDGPWNETHSYQRTEGTGGSEYSYQSKSVGPVAAGVCVHAKDTDRLLMLQRAYDETDPASGFWEFPGGCLEEGETPEAAALREWSEETGMNFPDSAVKIGEWLTYNGVYAGFVYQIEHESDLPVFDGRYEVNNPDDPDGDQVEALAWWDSWHAAENPAIRPELMAEWHRVVDQIWKDVR